VSAALDKSGRAIRDMFAGVAPRYDLLNHLLSASLDLVWRRRAAAALGLAAGAEVLDLCCGTGDQATALARRGARVAAADFCVPKAKMDSFFARKAPFFSELDVLGFSKLMQVHPGLVAGQIRNRTKRYDLFAKLLAKVRSTVVTTAVVDGWGETYPV